MLNVLVKVPPGDPDYDDVCVYIEDALEKVTEATGLGFRFLQPSEDYRQPIRRANIIIMDVSQRWENLPYELAYADALQKSTVVLCQYEQPLPANVPDNWLVKYDRLKLRKGLSPSLQEKLITIISGPKEIIPSQESRSRTSLMEKVDAFRRRQLPLVFVSYAKEDEQYFTAFNDSLITLQNENICAVWSEQNNLLSPGDKLTQLDEARDLALKRAAVIVVFMSRKYVITSEWKQVLRQANLILSPGKSSSEEKLIIINVDKYNPPKEIKELEAMIRFANGLNEPLGPMKKDEQNEVYEEVVNSIKKTLERFPSP